MNVPTADSWNAKKIVLSEAEEVVPLSTAYHWRSTAVFWTAAGFFRQLLPASFETEVPRLTSDSRSTKYSLAWSSVTMSVSPPPGPGSGLRPTGLSTWKERPPSVDRWMNELFVVVPQGPYSQMLPFWSKWSSGSPSVRCASTTVALLNCSLPATRLIVGGPNSPPASEPGMPTGGPFVTDHAPA